MSNLPIDPSKMATWNPTSIKSPTEGSASELQLTISKRGEWVFRDVSLGDTIEVILMAIRENRVCWGGPYRTDGSANHIVCRSWNGRDAYGLGRRPEPGEKWRMKLTDRSCKGCTTGHPVRGTPLDMWHCRPCYRCLVLFRRNKADKWTPAFYDARGTKAPQFRDMDGQLERMEAAERMPRWSYSRLLKIVEGKGSWWDLSYPEKPTFLGQGASEVNDLLLTNVPERLWNEDSEWSKTQMHTVGQDEDGDPDWPPPKREPETDPNQRHQRREVEEDDGIPF